MATDPRCLHELLLAVRERTGVLSPDEQRQLRDRPIVIGGGLCLRRPHFTVEAWVAEFSGEKLPACAGDVFVAALFVGES